VPERVNLYSDTQTQPTEGMRRAMADARVGDEQRKQDPTVNELQERVAALLGHDAALFLPTGTLCNIIGTRLHIRPGGDEVLLHRTAHPFVAEAAGPASISGATLHPMEGEGGIVSGKDFMEAVSTPGDRYGPRTRLLWVEQTTNLEGGRVWPISAVLDVMEVAGTHGLRAHLDGARLMNAVVASGIAPDSWASGFDTAWIDFSKGLGTPFGAVLAGSAELIDEAWRFKQMFGGALRQAGVIAAAMLYALDHHVDRLADDHEHAKLLAEGLAELDGVALDPAKVETNIVVFDVRDPAGFVAALDAEGVDMSIVGGRVRAVTHLDVDRAGIERALDVARAAIG
jgi:threonine aldolase